MDEFQKEYSFVGYVVKRDADTSFAEFPHDSGTYMYANKIPLAKNVFVVDYSDDKFFYTLFDTYGIDFYSMITALPALIVLVLTDLDNTKILYNEDILTKYAIFEQHEISGYYFKVGTGERTETKILRYMEDNSGKVQSLGLGLMN